MCLVIIALGLFTLTSVLSVSPAAGGQGRRSIPTTLAAIVSGLRLDLKGFEAGKHAENENVNLVIEAKGDVVYRVNMIFRPPSQYGDSSLREEASRLLRNLLPNWDNSIVFHEVNLRSVLSHEVDAVFFRTGGLMVCLSFEAKSQWPLLTITCG